MSYNDRERVCQYKQAGPPTTREPVATSQKIEGIDILSGDIAYDFNNTLGAMTRYTQILNNERPTEHQWQSHLQKILIAGQQAKDPVHQILTFSRHHE